jgi:hypothetical protein
MFIGEGRDFSEEKLSSLPETSHLPTTFHYFPYFLPAPLPS